MIHFKMKWSQYNLSNNLNRKTQRRRKLSTCENFNNKIQKINKVVSCENISTYGTKEHT